MRTLTLSELLAFAPLAVGQPPAPKPAEPKKESLEDDIAMALRTHPDILVADAEAHLANAKLQQTKQVVAQKVAAAKREKEKAVGELTSASKVSESSAVAYSKVVEQLQALKASNGTATFDLRNMELTVERYKVAALESERAKEAAKAKLANAEAEYEALVGKAAVNLTVAVGSDGKIDFRTVEFLLLESEKRRKSRELAAQPQPGSFAEQLLAALDKPVKLEAMKQADLATVYAALLKAANVNGLVRIPVREQTSMVRDVVRIDVPAGEHSLATWLQLVNDDTTAQMSLSAQPKDTEFSRPKRYELYVRDYGLLLAAPDLAPPDALAVHDYWKRQRDAKPFEPKK